ncbi:MAG: hypothetical protein ACOCWO_05505 [Candidatus Muiribacteriaceae bacterium]
MKKYKSGKKHDKGKYYSSPKNDKKEKEDISRKISELNKYYKNSRRDMVLRLKEY